MDNVLLDQGIHLASRAALIANRQLNHQSSSGDRAPYTAYSTDFAGISKLPNFSFTRPAEEISHSARPDIGPDPSLNAVLTIPPRFSAAASVVNPKISSVR